MATLISKATVNIFSDQNDLFLSLAKDFAERVNTIVDSKKEFRVVLSGGSTPISFFNILTTQPFRTQIPWHKVNFFIGDERYVPFESYESNYRMMKEHLFSKLPIPAGNIYPIPTDFEDPKDAVKKYEHTLRKAFHIRNNGFPAFDVIYLGLGEDAHTASLMPGNNYTDDKHSLVTAVWLENQKMYRVTLTPAAINHALNVIFLVTGSNKAFALHQVLEGSFKPAQYPAQLIQCVNNKNIWYLDQAAAGKLRAVI